MVPALYHRGCVSRDVIRHSKIFCRKEFVLGFFSANRHKSSKGILTDEPRNTFPLTKKEAFAFVEDVLEIPDASKKLDDDRLRFLDQFIKRMYIRIPFTAIKYQSQIKGYHDFKMPTFLEMKDDMFSRFGGTCFPITCFTHALLRQLDYECYVCDCAHDGKASTHNGIIVRHLSGVGSRHLVDTGAGVPFFRSVSLDFEKISPLYCDDYMTYRFVREVDGTVTCQKILAEDHFWDMKSSDFQKSSKIGGWASFMNYDTETSLDLDFLVEHYTKIFEVRNLEIVKPAMLYSLFLIGYPKGKLCSVTGNAWYCASHEGRIKYTDLTADDAVEVVLKYYPQFPRAMVAEALLNSRARRLNKTTVKPS